MAVRRSVPLRRWLTLLVLGTAGPLLAFAIIVLVWLVRGYQGDQERRHTDTTRALALAVDAEIRSWKASLQTLVESNDLQPDRLAAFDKEARAVAARYDGWIVLTDASGQQRLNTSRPFGALLPKTGTPDVIQTVFRTRQPVVTDLVFGAVSQRYIVAVVIPVMQEGQVRYTLDMAFAPERLVRLLAAQRFPPSWVVAITDGQQKIVVRVPERPDRLGQPVLPSFARAFAAQDSGTVEATTTDGRVGRSAFQHLREAPWSVNVMVPLAELNAAWQRPVLAFLLLGGLAACGAVGLAVVLARKIARPVTDAARLAAAVIHGETPALPASRIAEVADLQQALADGAGTVRTALEGREQALIALQEANQGLEARVTERTAALRDSEARFRALAGATFEGIAIASEGRYLDANEQWCHLLGYRREELLGRGIAADIAAEDRDRVLQSIREGGASHFEHAMVRRDGTRMLVEVRGRTVQYQNRIVRVAAIRDVTARHQAEAALRLSEEKFAKAFSANTAAMALTRVADGHILDTNAACLAVLGYTREELIGRSTIEVGIWCDPGARRRYVEMLHRHAPVRDWEVQFATKAGQPIEVLFSGELITVQGEEVILSTFLDITARKQAEAALQQAKEELEQRVQERTADLAEKASQLQALTAELTLAEQRERQRLAVVLHDGLQQLLVAAKFRVTLLPRADPKGIASGCREMEHLLDEAVAASRTLTGELSPPVLQIGGLVAGLEWLVRWKAEKYQLAVALDADPQAIPDSEAMTLLLFQSVRELLFNIVKHAQVRAAQVEVRRRDGHLQIVVRDQGIGFDPATLSATSLGGLGLSSIRQRLEYLGGCVEIASAPGQGCRITLVAPLQSRASASAARVTLAPAEGRPPRSPRRGAKTRILLVDDHTVVRQALAQMFAAEPDLEVVGEAADGQTGVARTKALQPDVVLMDINMPGMTGIEATMQIRAECPDVKVIGLSMFGASEQTAAMQQAGAVGYVSKSAPAEELLAAIRACAARNPAIGPDHEAL